MFRRGLVLATVTASLVFGAASASAQEDGGKRLPVSFVERPLTLPKLVFAPLVGLNVTHLSLTFGSTTVSDTAIDLAVGAAFGITDDLEVRAVVLPLLLKPDFRYTGPIVGATYRFLKGDVEIGAAVDALVQTQDPNGVLVEPGIPVRVHFGKVARLDTGAALAISKIFKDPTTNVVGIIPARVAFDIIESLHVGASTGVGMFLSGSNLGETLVIPAGVFGGYAVGGHDGPILDIDPFFSWPSLFRPGAPTGFDKVNTGFYQLGVIVTGYLYL